MAGLDNLKAILSNTRSRVVFIFTLLILVLAVVIGIGIFSRGTGEGQARLGKPPSDIHSIVGGFDKPVTPQYAKLLEEKNRREAQQAFQTNGTAVPTIIDSQALGNVNPQGNVCTPQNTILTPNGFQTTGTPPMGAICSDGTVRDANGRIIGKTGLVAPGGLVYDKNGKIIGTVGADGKVRDATGKVVGTLAADGTVRDANGNVIGTTTGGSQEGVVGKPVYDNSGKLLGYVGADGQVRDANGKVLGQAGPDGIVRDANGNVIGKAALGEIGAAKTGSLVFDRNGHVIGTIGPDGKVRDASGNIVGVVGADGTVRDNLGNVIGRVNGTSPGSAVYDAQGRFLGTVGADGKVRDVNGNVVGAVGADGVVRDASGKPIGRTNYIAPGSAVYGADGRLIGSVGPDGRLIPATLGPGGTGLNGSLSGGTPQEQAAAKQQQVLQEQKSHQMVLQLQAAMSGQMSQLISSWTPPTQQVVTSTAEKAGEGLATGGGSGAGGAAGAGAGGGVAFVKAGTIMFAVLDTAVNSDEPGPIMATITEGKLKGGKLLGTMALQGEHAMLTFNTISLPGATASVPINTVAIDPGTARTALSSDTNNHYMLRYGTMFASSFLSGYAQALSQSGSQTTITVNGIVHQIPAFNSQQKVMMALGNVGQQYSSALSNLVNTPATVKIYAGTGLGILFLSDMAPPAGMATTNSQS